MLTLVLTRHGATPLSEPEQHLGQRIDVSLSEKGRSDAEALGGRLEGVDFERVVSSPLKRAQETAAIVAPAERVETDARLAEMDYGRWEGLTYEQIDEVDADARRAWEQNPAELACPGGESGADVCRRVTSLLEDLVGEASEDEDRLVLAVGHSTTNRILLTVALGVPLGDYRRRFRQEPANLTVLRFGGPVEAGAQLLLGNDVAHMRGVRGVTWR